MGLFDDYTPVFKGLKRHDGSDADHRKPPPDAARIELSMVVRDIDRLLSAINDVRDAIAAKNLSLEIPAPTTGAPAVDFESVAEAIRGMGPNGIAEAISKLADVLANSQQNAARQEISPRSESLRMRVERDGRGRISEIFVFPNPIE